MFSILCSSSELKLGFILSGKGEILKSIPKCFSIKESHFAFKLFQIRKIICRKNDLGFWKFPKGNKTYQTGKIFMVIDQESLDFRVPDIPRKQLLLIVSIK